jgi:hypothetical protein
MECASALNLAMHRSEIRQIPPNFAKRLEGAVHSCAPTRCKKGGIIKTYFPLDAQQTFPWDVGQGEVCTNVSTVHRMHHRLVNGTEGLRAFCLQSIDCIIRWKPLPGGELSAGGSSNFLKVFV